MYIWNLGSITIVGYYIPTKLDFIHFHKDSNKVIDQCKSDLAIVNLMIHTNIITTVQ